MSRWMINARGQQYSASSMEELRQFAKRGDLTAGDIVQPPGAADWIYALEVPELKGSLRADLEMDADAPAPAREFPPVVRWVAAAALALTAVGAWSYALGLRDTIPQPDDLELIGGKSGLSFSEVLVTAENGQLYAAPDANSAVVSALTKNAKAELLAKRGKWYRLRADGKEGYAAFDTVIPAYFFGNDVDKLTHDPLYNPDKYVYVRNSSWQLLPEGGNKNVTVFTFLMQNDAKFAMTDVKLLVTIKDKNDAVLETKEIAVEGTIPAEFSTMVGVLKADKRDKSSVDRIMSSSSFEEMAKADPDLVERWLDGVEVRLTSDGFTEAAIELLEVRAVPAEAAK
ncbi:MAG: SH3 domain-containing protein [Pseudomonadota bacterium]|nr:SH3 domain-containing protein [Pseudomonadota bacterium]